MYRAIFSALDEKSLSEAYWGVDRGPNQNESDAVEVRQELDLKIGVAWTRFQTKFFGGKFRDLDAKTISYGPCQTPTLWFCVQRDDEIKAFRPEKYQMLTLKIKVMALFAKIRAKLKILDPNCTQERNKRFREKYKAFTE